jgi:hypothetical protein
MLACLVEVVAQLAVMNAMQGAMDSSLTFYRVREAPRNEDDVGQPASGHIQWRPRDFFFADPSRVMGRLDIGARR